MVSITGGMRIKENLPPNIPIYSSFENSFEANETSELSILKQSAADFKCERVGRFAYPSSCEKYYFCWDTIHDHAVFNCPYDQAFNPKTQRCAIDYAVCDAAPISKCYSDRQLLSNPEDKFSYFECILISKPKGDSSDNNQYRLYKENCPNGGEFDTDLGYCKLTTEDENDSSESDENGNSKKLVECKEDGVFIDYSDDSRYYECIIKNVTYARIHQTCPYHHVFSMADKRCIRLDTDEFQIRWKEI